MEMIKTGKWLVVAGLVGLLSACGKDGRDDTVLDMALLTGKDWYYNAWIGDKDSYEARDLLEIVRFERGGTLKTVDFGGRQEYIAGKWFADANNRISMEYANGEKCVWNVQRSGEDYIRTIVNEQGVREYTLKPGYLGELTADAFWVNEYTSGNVFRTRIGVDVRGNINIREGQVLLAGGKRMPLVHHEYYWSEDGAVDAGVEGKDQEVRFYLRLGKDNHVKLRDSVFADNLPKRTPAETDLNVTERNGAIRVTWNPYPGKEVYYRIEVLPEDMDLTNPYFISRIQQSGSGVLEVSPTTAGEVNSVGELRSGKTYAVRLSALLYEPDVDPWNHNYGYANVQAVAYFTKMWHKE